MHKNPGSDINDEPVFFQVGRLLKPHGTKGEINLYLTANFQIDISIGSSIYIGPKHDRYQIITKRGSGNPQIVSFESILTREIVSQFSNQNFYVRRNQLPDLKKGEFFHHEIVGLEVYDEEGKKLGKIREILSTGSNDVYIIDTETTNEEILIPAIKSAVFSIDIEKNIMVVRLPEWY